METTTNEHIKLILEVQLLDREIAELQAHLDAMIAERNARAELVHEALDALRALAPKIQRGRTHRFTDDEIREFRRRHQLGVPASVIAREAHVSGQAMRQILAGRTYKDVV